MACLIPLSQVGILEEASYMYIDLGFYCFWFLSLPWGFFFGFSSFFPLHKYQICHIPISSGKQWTKTLCENCGFLLSTSNCFSIENETWFKTWLLLLLIYWCVCLCDILHIFIFNDFLMVFFLFLAWL